MKKVTASTSNANGVGGSGRSNDSLNSSSIENGQLAFQHLISGVPIKKFMAENFEKKPLYIERANPKHYENLKVSTQSIDEMLRSNIIEFTKNIDITSYENGVRETHNPDGNFFHKNYQIAFSCTFQHIFLIPFNTVMLLKFYSIQIIECFN